MTTRELLVKINGDQSGLTTSLDKAGTSVTNFGKKAFDTFAKMRDVMQGPVAIAKQVFAAIEGLVKIGAGLYNEYASAERAMISFNTAIETSGTMSGGASKRLSDLALSLQKTSIFEADATLAIMANLVAMGRSEDQISDLIEAASNLSAATGQDLQTSITQLNATLNGNAGILGRQNGAVRALTEEELKAGKAIEIVSAQFRGMAEAMGTSAFGAAEKLKNSFGDLKEALGGMISINANYILDSYTWAIDKLTENVNKKLTTLKVENILKPMLDGKFSVAQITKELSASGMTWGNVVDELTSRLEKTNKEYAKFGVDYKGTTGYQEEIAPLLSLLSYARDRVAIDAELAEKAKAAAALALADAEAKKKEADAIKAAADAEEALNRAYEEANANIIYGLEPTHEYSDNLKELLANVTPVDTAWKSATITLEDLIRWEKEEADAVKKSAEEEKARKEAVIASVSAYVELAKSLADAAIATGLLKTKNGDLDDTFSVLENGASGLAKALSGDYVGAINDVVKIIPVMVESLDWLAKKMGLVAKTQKEIAEEEKKAVEDQEEAGNARLKQVEKELAAYEKIVKERADALAKIGESIGSALGQNIIDGLGKADFMAAMGKLLINSMVASVLATGPIAAQMTAIGEKMSEMYINGFTDAGIAEVEAMASALYSSFSSGILPVVEKIRGIFGTGSSGGGEEPTSSFASGVRNFSGGFAMVGEQGPERVRLPAGSSVISRGESARGGNTSIVFNSPRELDPMETQRRYQVMNRQLAWEGNLA